MSQLQVTGEAKIRDIQGPVVANSGVVTALDGAASQYVRGDGTLADFPTSSGGGSSVSYYLNSSVSQGTIGGVAYRELSKDPIIGAGTDIAISANGYVANYLTDANDPDVILVPGGNFNCEFYFSVNNNTGNPTTYAELYKYDGTTFTLLGTSAGVPESINQGTTIAPYYFAIPVATAALSVTDRLAIRIYVNVDGRTVTLHTENGHLCQVVTTLSKGMVSLNNLTDQSQYLATGTSGTNFAIVSSGDTHTFNLPVASATNTGKLSSTDWSTFNGKVPYTGATTNVNLGVYSLTANQVIAGGAGVDNVASFTTFDQGFALKLKGSTGDLFFVPYFSPSVGAKITAQDTAGSGFTPLSIVASTINIVGDLIGKAATFGGNIVQLLTIDSAAIGGSYIALKKQGTLNGAIGMGANTIASNTDTDLGLWATGAIAFQTNSVVRLTIASSGAATFTGNVTASSIIKSGGTSSQFLMADGSVNTSVLPSGAYLPLAGGTLTGALNGTTAAFSDSGTATNTNLISLLQPNLTAYNGPILTIGKSIGINNAASIQFYYTSNNSSSNALTLALYGSSGLTIYGNGNASFVGTLGLGGALSGTSATFSGNVNVGTNIAQLLPITTTNFQILTGCYYDGSNIIATATSGTRIISNAGSFTFNNFTGATIGSSVSDTPRLTIASTGAATFSSSVTANGLYANAGNSARFYRSANDYYWGVNNDSNNYLNFGTFAANGTAYGTNPKMILLDNGNVGIGISAPTATLHTEVNSSTWVSKIINTNTTTNNAGLLIKAGVNSGNEILLAQKANGTTVFLVDAGGVVNVINDLGVGTATPSGKIHAVGINASSANNVIYLENAVATVLFRIRNDGAFFTGTGSSSPYNNTSGGSANLIVTAAGTLERSTSSLKYKKDVRNYDKGIDIVKQMRPVYYKGKGENDGNKQYAGLIAEEIHELGLTEFVQYAEDGTPDALAYQNMIALAFKAIQELKAEIDELKNK